MGRKIYYLNKFTNDNLLEESNKNYLFNYYYYIFIFFYYFFGKDCWIYLFRICLYTIN